MKLIPAILLSLPAVAALVTGVKLLKDFHRSAVHPGDPGKYKATTRFRLPAMKGAGPATETRNTEAQRDPGAYMSSNKILLPVVQQLNLERKWSLSAEDAVSRISGAMRVELDSATSTFSLTVWSDEKDETAAIANAVRESFIEHLNETAAGQFRRLTLSVQPDDRNQLEVVEKHRLEMNALQEKSASEPDFAAAKVRYESALNLLYALREAKARAKLDEPGPSLQTMEILEVAQPGPVR